MLTDVLSFTVSHDLEYGFEPGTDFEHISLELQLFMC